MKFSVPDMSCGHCTSSIENAVKQAYPDAKITCDLESRTVTLENVGSEQEIIVILDDIGFDANHVAS